MTPMRLNSSRCTLSQCAANFRHSSRKALIAAGSRKFGFCLLLARYCSSIFHSIGRPWQSHPGTKFESCPSICCDLTYEILQDLVQRVADVDVAVGVGRPVMQREFHAALRLGTQLLVKPDFVPALQQFRLEFWQPGAHRKLRLRQEKRLAPVAAALGGRMGRLGNARLGRSLRVFRHQVIFRPQICGRSSNCAAR